MLQALSDRHKGSKDNMKPNVFKSIYDADNEQWSSWQRMTPAQRWDESVRIWLESYDIRRKAKNNSLRAIRHSFGRV